MRNLKFLPYTKSNFLDAIKEFISLVVASFLPVWLGILFNWLSPEASVRKFVLEFLSSGEALLISAALVGPLIYILFKRYGNMPKGLSLRFPLGWFIVSSILVISVVSAGVFGYKSATIGADNIAPENLLLLSSAMLVASLIILFIVYVIRNNIEGSTSEIMRTETSEFLKAWDRP